MKTAVRFTLLTIVCIFGGLAAGTWLSERTEVIRFKQDNNLKPVMVEDVFDRDTTITDTVLHGGKLYYPTIQYWYFEINKPKVWK